MKQIPAELQFHVIMTMNNFQLLEVVFFWLLKIGNYYLGRSMLYLLRNLKTSLSFSPWEIDKIANVKEIWAKLKEKCEGKCTIEYGLIINITNPDMETSKTKTSLARLDNHGMCVLDVQFSAISFKAQKNDLIYCQVTELTPECITACIRMIEIKIPRALIDSQLEYDRLQNCYRLRNKSYKIEIGDSLFCKVFQSRIEMSSQIKIIAELPLCLVNVNIDKFMFK